MERIERLSWSSLAPSGPQAKRRTGLGRRVRLVMAILIALALIILIVMQDRTPDVQKATNRARDFVTAMQNDKADEAFGMGNESFRNATTEHDLGVMFDKAEPFVKGARVEQTDVYYATSPKGGPRAIVVYTATVGDHVTYIRLVMERQADKDVWQAHSLLTQSKPLQAKPE